MHTHRLESFLIADNVRLEIVHESNPYFAGDKISLIIRLRHLGSSEELNQLKKKIEQNQSEIDAQRRPHKNLQGNNTDNNDNGNNNKAWSMRSLLTSPFRGSLDSNDINASKIKELSNERAVLQTQLMFHEPVDLISSYVQISGIFQYNLDVINEDSLVNKGTKIVGVHNKNHPDKHSNSNNNNINNNLKYSTLNSNTLHHDSINSYLNSNFDDFNNLNKKFIITPGSDTNLPTNNYNEVYNELPIFLIPQTLLFSEISLKPGDVKTFHFKSSSKLPLNLCPSYNNHSRNISISYMMEFGVSIIKNNDNSLVPYRLKIPIIIAPYIDNKSGQYTMTLDNEPFIMKPASIKEIPSNHERHSINNSAQNSNSSSSRNQQQEKRRSSMNSMFIRRRSSVSTNIMAANNDSDQKNLEKVEKLSTNFVELMKWINNDDGDIDIDKLVDIQLSKQFGDNDINNDDVFDENNKLIYKHISIARNNIINLKRNIPRDIEQENNTIGNDNDEQQQEGIIENPNNLKPQLTSNLQKRFIINRNGKLIAKINFSKLFYTTSDNIDLTILPEPLEDIKISAIKVTLQCVEIFNKKYVVEPDKIKPNFMNINEEHIVSFDDCQSIPLKLVLPKSPTKQYPGQFKTNIFEFKWIISFTFILISKREEEDSHEDPEDKTINNNTLGKFYEDSKGILYHSVESLEGEEFSFKMPITILPTSEDYGGW